MFEILLLALGLLTSPAQAQNPQCPDRPVTDQTNACANTRFIARAVPVCNVKTMGAIGNGVANDTAAFTACSTQLAATGGTIFVPPGTYCLNTGFTLTNAVAGVTLEGSGLASVISACGNDVTTLTVDSVRNTVRDLIIVGPNIIATTHDAVLLTANCVECNLVHTYVVFGRHAVNNAGFDNFFLNNNFNSAYGSSIFYNTGQLFGYRNKVDQPYPISSPVTGTTYAAWQSNNNYTTVGTVVSTNGYYIQLKVAGTSGNVAPTLQTYGTNIVDNGATWLLVGKTDLAAVQLDTGSTVVTMDRTDHSGSYDVGLRVTNSLAGVAPQSTTITNSYFTGYTTTASIEAGNGFNISGNQFSGCIKPACEGILFLTTGGDVTFSNNQVLANPYGVSINGGANYSLIGNYISSSSVTAINIGANINNFTIVGNQVGGSAFWGANAVGVTVQAGTSDHYNISSNVCFGAPACVVDGGTGTDKVVQGTLNYPVVLLGKATNVNLNSANTDTAITISTPVPNWNIQAVVVKNVGTTASLTTVTAGLFSTTGGGGIDLCATQALSPITSNTVNTDANAMALSCTKGTRTWMNQTTIQFRVVVAQGAAATADVYVIGRPLP